MDGKAVDEWLGRYVMAWRSYEPEAIGDLFSQDAEYRYHPWDEPIRGRDNIVASWLEDQDAPGTYYGIYSAVTTQGDRAVATGTSTYLDEQGSPERIFHNCFVLTFDGDGRCRSFTEWFMQEPAPAPETGTPAPEYP